LRSPQAGSGSRKRDHHISTSSAQVLLLSPDWRLNPPVACLREKHGKPAYRSWVESS
jgi:hypothetical protein